MTAHWGYDFGKPLSTYGLTAEQETYVLTVARDWQSPGTVGCEFATLASTKIVSDELAGDISRTIRQIRMVAPELGSEYARDTAESIADLKIVANTLGLELDEDVR